MSSFLLWLASLLGVPSTTTTDAGTEIDPNGKPH
jgi:hypothetical protein